MGDLKKIYLMIQNNVLENDIREAIITFNHHYERVKDLKGFQNFTISVISTLAHKLQSELVITEKKQLRSVNVNDVIELSDCCFKILIESDIKPWQNSLYVIVRYLLSKNCITEAVYFSNYILKHTLPPCEIIKLLVQLLTHDIYKRCPIDDDLKKLNILLMWETVLNLVKYHTGKEMEYALHSLSSLVKNVNGPVKHEGRTIDLVLLEMTIETVLSSSVFRKTSNHDNMMNLYSLLIESITAVMHNMMKNKQIQVHFLIKHVELMIDVCCLNKTEKESLNFLILLFKLIHSSVKNGLDVNIELRKISTFIQKHNPESISPHSLLYYVFKAAVTTVAKLKNLWYDELMSHSREATSQMFQLIQNLILFSKNNPFCKTCCKSEKCNLNVDVTSLMSLINIVFIIIRHTVPVNPTYLCSEEIEMFMEIFFSLYTSVDKSKCSNKISFKEFSLTSAYNLCINLESGEFFKTFLNFLYKLNFMLDDNDIDAKLVARITVLLSRYLYTDNKFEDALKCTAYSCIRTKSEIAAQQWVHLKCKEEKNGRIVKHTILKMVEKDIEKSIKWPSLKLEKTDDIDIMWLELKAHNNRSRIKQDISTVLELFESLLSHKLSTEFKCRIIIATAYIILHSDNVKGLERVIEVIDDVTHTLEVDSAMNTNNMSLVIGNMYYAQFMCSLKHLQNLVCKELDSYIEERQEPGIEQQSSLYYQPMSWIVPLKIQPKLFNYLNLALKHWSNIKNFVIQDEYDLQTLFISLRETGYIYKLHCDSKEVEVWKLLHNIALMKKCDKYIFIALLEQVKIGLIDIKELEIVANKLPKMNIEYKLTLIISFLNFSNFNEAKILLDSINIDDFNNDIILTAEYYYIKSRYHFESLKFDPSKTLSVFIDAYNISHNLIKRLDSFSDYLVMHFILLNICSYLNLIYVNTFKPVEARCFLKVQMNIVLKSVLTKRALHVFSMNCWNELVSCNFENFNGQLEHLMTLLDFKEDDVDLKMQKLTIHDSPCTISSPLSDYRCVPNPRPNRIASPSLKRLNDSNFQMSLMDFCNDTLESNKSHDPTIAYSVIELCILKAVYCSKTSQKNMAENYFKLIFKLISFFTPKFNKNEVYNILKNRQVVTAKYYFAEHLIRHGNKNQSLNYLQKAKKNYIDPWISLSAGELDISFKMDTILSYCEPKVSHSPSSEMKLLKEFKTPAATKSRIKSTPTVRRLKMELESPSKTNLKINKENSEFKTPAITKVPIKSTPAVRRIKMTLESPSLLTKKENSIKSSNRQDSSVKVKEKRSSKKKDTEQSLIVKKRPGRLNI
ncbi:uncharacterized protein LOC126897756 isoform X2 [Daktulosphaira vitifoliae]|nr:uncharacterized protein LOC126897756 isoform X2 [Daktulosphaira vitifoliae]